MRLWSLDDGRTGTDYLDSDHLEDSFVSCHCCTLLTGLVSLVCRRQSTLDLPRLLFFLNCLDPSLNQT